MRSNLHFWEKDLKGPKCMLADQLRDYYSSPGGPGYGKGQRAPWPTDRRCQGARITHKLSSHQGFMPASL